MKHFAVVLAGALASLSFCGMACADIGSHRHAHLAAASDSFHPAQSAATLFCVLVVWFALVLATEAFGGRLRRRAA